MRGLQIPLSSMADLSMNDISLTLRTESGEEIHEHHPLPDRFFNSEISDKMWAKILPTRYKMKEYLEALIRNAGTGLPKKNIKMIPVGRTLSVFLGSVGVRENLYNIIDDDDMVARELIIERHLERLLKKLPVSFRETKGDISKEAFLLVPFVIRPAVEFLRHFASESNYKSLSHDEMDIADFCVNTLLIKSRSNAFIVKFFDETPWLRSKQTRLYESSLALLEEEDDADNGEPNLEDLESSTSIWKMVGNRFVNIFDDYESIGLPQVLEADAFLDEFLSDKRYSPTALFNLCLYAEAHSLTTGIGGFLNTFESWGKESDEVLDEMREALESIDLELPSFPLNEKTRPFVLDFYNQKVQSSIDSKAGIDEFLAANKEKMLIKERMSRIIEDSDHEKLSLIPGLSDELKVAIEKISTCTQILVAWFMASYKAHTTLIAGLKSATSPIVKLSAPPTIDDTERELNEELQRALNASQQALEQSAHIAKEAQRKEDEMAQINEHLIDEIDQLKRALHAAKSMPIVEKGGAELSTELSGEWLRSLLKGDGGSTPEQILVAYANIAPDRLVVMPSALKSAREADNFELSSRLAQMIDSLIYPYLDGIQGGMPDCEAKSILGNRYAANESQTVASNSRLRSMREFNYNGETIYFRQHIGIGSGYGTQHALRLHFKVIDGKVVIAYCGAHMETMRTN